MTDHKIGQQFNGCEVGTVNQTDVDFEDYVQAVTMKCTESQRTALREQARAEGMDMSRWLREAYKIRMRYAGYQSRLIHHEDIIKKLLDTMSDAHIPERVFRSPR